jgi:AraC-like DNA-binding protein
MSRPTTNAPTVHVGKAWRLILSDLGLSSQVVLRLAGLPAGLLDGEGTRIPLGDFYTLWETCAHEANDPELSLRLGQVVSVELFDPALFAAMCSPDMNTAARRLGEFKRLVGAFSLDVEILHDVTNISYRCKYRPDVPLTMGLAEIVFLVSFARRATRQTISPVRVVLPFAVPSVEAYEAWFGCPVSVDKSYTLTLSAADARRPFMTHDDQMWEFFEPSLRRRMGDAKVDASIRARVEHALTELLPSGRAQIEDVARELAVSKRTLQRRLSEEGTSWLKVLNGSRERLARHYLGSTNLGVGEVSFLLGFEDPNSLFRAFHRWTGTTPEAWRANLRA